MALCSFTEVKMELWAFFSVIGSREAGEVTEVKDSPKKIRGRQELQPSISGSGVRVILVIILHENLYLKNLSSTRASHFRGLICLGQDGGTRSADIPLNGIRRGEELGSDIKG